MKTKLILLIIFNILLLGCEKTPTDDYDSLINYFSVAFLDAQTHENLLDTTAEAYYHIDSLKIIKQNGEIGNLIFTDDFAGKDFVGSFHFFPEFGFRLEIRFHGADWQWEDFEKIYGNEMDTTLYLYLNQYETDTINIILRKQPEEFIVRYFGHDTITSNLATCVVLKNTQK